MGSRARKTVLIVGMAVLVVCMVLGGVLAGYRAGRDSRDGEVERVSVTSFNDGFQDGTCRPTPGTEDKNDRPWIEDGNGNSCLEGGDFDKGPYWIARDK
ncbi:hypothetical protein CTZ27_03235 [Streptomyces griseocarneus]|nr:hypothetical protein CTZ27_03235 [Streptomyces griseocarneus]